MGENLWVQSSPVAATTALFTLAVTRPLPTAQQKACTGSVYRAGKKYEIKGVNYVDTV